MCRNLSNFWFFYKSPAFWWFFISQQWILLTLFTCSTQCCRFCCCVTILTLLNSVFFCVHFWWMTKEEKFSVFEATYSPHFSSSLLLFIVVLLCSLCDAHTYEYFGVFANNQMKINKMQGSKKMRWFRKSRIYGNCQKQNNLKNL